MKKSYSDIINAKFKNVCDKYSMLETKSVLVGLSGGADSVTLLHLLNIASKTMNFSLHAIHINHLIRGDEAMRDELFCRELCNKLGISIRTIRIDVPKIAAQLSQGIEEAARNIRYEQFELYCKSNNIEKIATAHNASDNLETLIFNIARGSCTHGGGGIAPLRSNIIRPLITCTKEEILGYVRENSLDFVTDSTNTDTSYTRNFIRAKIAPLIKELNPEAESAASRFCSLLREDDAFLNRMASQHTDSDSVGELACLEFPLLSRIIVIKFFQAANTNLTAAQIDSIIAIIKKADKKPSYHASLSLPGKTALRIEDGKISFCEDCREQIKSPEFCFELLPGVNKFNKSDFTDCMICLWRDIGPDEKKIIEQSQRIYNLSINTVCNFDKIKGSVYARSRKSGDVYRLHGMNKKVKKMMCDAKIPLSRRNALPLLCDNSDIFYIPEFDVSDNVRGIENPLYIYYFERI